MLATVCCIKLSFCSSVFHVARLSSYSMLEWQECIPSLGSDKMANVSVMYSFTNDSKNGIKFSGYRVQATANSSIFTEAQNIVVGNPFPNMLKVPPGNTDIIFLYYVFLTVAHQCHILLQFSLAAFFDQQNFISVFLL